MWSYPVFPQNLADYSRRNVDFISAGPNFRVSLISKKNHLSSALLILMKDITKYWMVTVSTYLPGIYQYLFLCNYYQINKIYPFFVLNLMIPQL